MKTEEIKTLKMTIHMETIYEYDPNEYYLIIEEDPIDIPHVERYTAINVVYFTMSELKKYCPQVAKRIDLNVDIASFEEATFLLDKKTYEKLLSMAKALDKYEEINEYEVIKEENDMKYMKTKKIKKSNILKDLKYRLKKIKKNPEKFHVTFITIERLEESYSNFKNLIKENKTIDVKEFETAFLKCAEIYEIYLKSLADENYDINISNTINDFIHSIIAIFK